MSSDVPLARRLVLGIAIQLKNREPFAHDVLMEAHRLMVRQKPIRKARSKAQPLTREMKFRVRELAADWPDMTYQMIAEETGIRSVGRISEILNGKR